MQFVFLKRSVGILRGPLTFPMLTSYFMPRGHQSAVVASAKRPRDEKAIVTQAEKSRKGAANEDASAVAHELQLAHHERSGGAGAFSVTPHAPVDPRAALSALGIEVHPSWAPVIAAEARKQYFSKLQKFVAGERAKGTEVFPAAEHVYSALALTPLDSIKVIILGQDPYHGPGQAHGLAFSVQKGIAPPPSLVNILKEVQTDVGPTGSLRQADQPHGSLEYWARQGVLLLNAVLTVNKGLPQSHQKQGWEDFTSAVIKAVADRRQGVVFVLWGMPAQKKGALVSKSKHLVLEAPHPSPLSSYRGFFGCKHFTQANTYLQKQGKAPIDWSLDPPPGWQQPASSGAGASSSE